MPSGRFTEVHRSLSRQRYRPLVSSTCRAAPHRDASPSPSLSLPREVENKRDSHGGNGEENESETEREREWESKTASRARHERSIDRVIAGVRANEWALDGRETRGVCFIQSPLPLPPKEARYSVPAASDIRGTARRSANMRARERTKA